jgi:hypothetical protein
MNTAITIRVAISSPNPDGSGVVEVLEPGFEGTYLHIVPEQFKVLVAIAERADRIKEPS